MEISEAKRKLISELQEINRGILGGGIRKEKGEPVIVVFVSKPEFQHNIPGNYLGNKVVTEIKKLARAY